MYANDLRATKPVVLSIKKKIRGLYFITWLSQLAGDVRVVIATNR